MPEGLTGPGDFELDECTLVTTSGMKIDLKGSVVGIILYEGIGSIAVSGDLVITDPTNLSSTGPLIGHEYLFLKIRTPGLIGFTEDESIIDFSENVFIVNNVSAREPAGNIQVLALHFVSQELVKNQRLRVHQSLVMSWSDIVKHMMTEYIDTKKKMIIEPSIGIKKFIAPSIRPLDLIVLATKQALAKYNAEPTYIFYESLKGFNFRTLASLYNQSAILEYTDAPAGNNPKIDQQYDLVMDLQNILSYQIARSNETLINYRTGMFGSKLITHDIINKSYQNSYYKYHDNFKDEIHIASGGLRSLPEFPITSELYVAPGMKTSDFPSRQFLYPITSSGGVDAQHLTENNTSPYISQDPHKWLQRRTSQMIQLENGFQINMTVHGNTIISAGDIVLLNLPQRAGQFKMKESVDRLYRGRFLVRKIRHDFNFSTSPPKHQMIMNLVKDSLETELDASIDNMEPSSDKDGILEDYDYADF